MSTSGHTNSDGAKSRKHGFLFKKIRLGAIVFLAFALTIVGSVGSTVLADPPYSGPNSGLYTETTEIEVGKDEKLYKAKYYSILISWCISVPIHDTYRYDLDKSAAPTLGGNGDIDEALTVEKAMKGIFDGDHEDDGGGKWYSNYKAAFPYTDTILGSSYTSCDGTDFGSGRNQGLIAAWVDSLVDLRDKNSSGQECAGNGCLNLNAKWNNMSIEDKATLFYLMGFRAHDENGKDSFFENSVDGIKLANDKLRSYSKKEKDNVTLNYAGLRDGVQTYGDIVLSRVVDKIQSVFDIYNRASGSQSERIDKLTNKQKYIQYDLAYSGRCMDYNNDNSYAMIETHTYPKISGNKLYKETFRVPTASSLENSNFLNFDNLYRKWNSDKQINGPKSAITESVSCRADANSTVWAATRTAFEEYAKEYYSSCLVDYTNNTNNIKNQLNAVDPIADRSNAENKAYARVHELPTEPSWDQTYDMCIVGSSQSGSTRNKSIYSCNGQWMKEYLRKYSDEIEKATQKIEDAIGDELTSASTNEIFESYNRCFHVFEGSAVVEDEYGYKKYSCNQTLLTGLANINNRIIVDYYMEEYEAVKYISDNDIYGPLEEYEDIKQEVSQIDAAYESIITTANQLRQDFRDLPSSSDLNNAVNNLNVADPRTGLRILFDGIDKFSQQNYEEVTLGCNVDGYLKYRMGDNYEDDLKSLGVEVNWDYTNTENSAGSMPDIDPNDQSHGNNGGGTYDTTETCEGQVVMGWVICQAARFMTDAASKIYDSISETWIAMDRKETSQESGTYTVWQSFVNIANIVLVILFLFVIFSQLTGYGIDNYGIKRVLPKLIMVAILINLSFIICQIVVDVTNIIGVNIEGFLDNIEVGSSSLYESPGDGGIVNFIGNLLAVAGLGAVGIGVTFKVLDHNLLSFLFGALIILLVVLIAILFFFVQLGIRKAAVITLIAISPLAIVCYALPNTKKYFDKWLNGFKALMLVYPMCGLVQGMSRLIARMMSDASSSFIGAVVIAAILVFPYFFIPSLVAKAVSAVTSLGERMSQLGRGIRKRATDGIKNTEHYKEAQDRRKDAEALRRGTTREAIEQRHRRRNGVDATQVADAEAQRRAAINTLSDPNSSIADRRRARRELAAANRTLGRAKDIQKYEDNYLNKQKEAQETTARAGYQGDYVATMDAAQGRAAQNAFNVKMGDAENLSPEITIEMARHQARTRVEDTQLSLEKQEREYALKGGDNDAARDLYIATMRRQQNINTDSEFNKRLGQARATTDLDRVSLEEATNAARMHQQDERISRERNRLEYNARQDYGAANGIDYEEVMTNSLAPGVESEFNTKIAQAENPAAAVSLATARSRVSSKRRSESYQAYFDQFSSLTPAQQKAELTRLISQQGTGTGDTNMDDVRALADVMVKMGASDDVQEVLGAAIGSANFSTANWEEIRNNQTKLDSYIEIMGKTGSISGKGFAKYLAKMTAAGNQANAVSYEEWIRGGATGNAALTANDDLQYNSFEAFVDNNYQGGDVVDKMSKNEMKFIISQTNREDRRTPAVPDGSRTISKLDVGELKKGAIGKTGDELRYANEMIALKKTDFTSTIGPGHSAVDFYNQLNLGPAEIAKLDLTTLIAIVGEDPNDPTKPNSVALTAFTAAISDSLTRARSDPRISHNLRDERVRQYLNL